MAGARTAAPNPAKSSRRSSRRMRSAIGRCGPLFAGYVQLTQVGPGGCEMAFFCCEQVGPCYKPAARGIAAGHDAILAGVAELVDALDLGSSDESCGGSSPSARTNRSILKRLQ